MRKEEVTEEAIVTRLFHQEQVLKKKPYPRRYLLSATVTYPYIFIIILNK